MPDSLETAALNGSLFTFDPTPPSPTRSDSTASLDDDEPEPGSEAEPAPSSSRLGQRGDTAGRGVPKAVEQVEHDGPQTGPKGVIEDRRAANTLARAERDQRAAAQLEEANRRAMIGLTIHEEDDLRSKEAEDQEVEEWRRRRKAQLAAGHDGDEEGDGDGGRRESIKRGGLRELGMEGYVDAVERLGWVVVLIYEPGIPRCTSILASLLHLSLNLPNNLATPISLYRALASTLSFSLLPPSQSHTASRHDDEGAPKGRPDPDVLPTMLVYRDGELERNWVRVDWDVKEDGVEGLLRREGILPPSHPISGTGINSQRSSHDDDDDEDE